MPDGDNRHYADTNSAQTLKQTDIGGLREKGASGKEIIQMLVENSSTWETKTEFSKQKYLKKKQQKYMPRVRFLRCTAESLCRTYRLKNPSKICNLREDTLGQILVYGNIFAGAQVLVVDTCMGLVTGAVAERQGGSGRLICPYEGQQPSADILRRFNFGMSVVCDKTYGCLQLFIFVTVCRQAYAGVHSLLAIQASAVTWIGMALCIYLPLLGSCHGYSRRQFVCRKKRKCWSLRKLLGTVYRRNSENGLQRNAQRTSRPSSKSTMLTRRRAARRSSFPIKNRR